MIIDIQRYLVNRAKSETPQPPEGKIIDAADRFVRRRNDLPPAA